MLTLDQIKEIVLGEINPRIKAARCMSDKLRLHVDGVGMQDFLARINNYENEKQFEARKKHAISNKAVIEDLLRNVDNAFSARGGSKNYEFTTKSNEEKFIIRLTDVKSSLSLSEYIEQVWFHKFVTDPNGLMFVEVKSEEVDGEEVAKAEPTYKSIYSIRDYEQNGNGVDWVIFEPHAVEFEEDGKKEKSKRFWYADKVGYYEYEQSREGLKEVSFIENSFGEVPAVLCSNLIDPITGWKKSPIDAQVELLNKYLISNSVLSIAEFFHNYPQQWTYIDECPKCEGSGTFQDKPCDKCDGSGKRSRKDVTDTIELKIPANDQAKIAPDISGYITLPTDAWTLMTDSVDRSSELIYYSHWGTTQEKSDSATATGRFIDVQPVNNRLDKYSSSIEMMQTNLANLLGKFYFPETFERAFIQYGRRYLIETPDQIWEKYLKAKEKNAPVTTLDLLLTQYIESEFRENEQAFFYESKKALLEPFVHWDITTVKTLGVQLEDYTAKLYYNEWIATVSRRDIIEKSTEDLRKELYTFTNQKIVKPKIEENE